MIALREERPSDEFLSESEAVQELKAAGRASVLGVLFRSHISSDVSLRLQPGQTNSRYHQIMRFAVRHADSVLLPEDSDLLLAREGIERRHQEYGNSDPVLSAWWAIAAARLQPAKAGQILSAAWERDTGQYEEHHRAQVAAELLRSATGPKAALIRDWFFTHSEAPGAGSSRQTLLRALAALPDPAPVRSWLISVIRDPRLDRLGWRDLEAVVRLANRLANQPVVPEEVLNRASFVGVDFSYSNAEESMKTYPKQTREIMDTLDGWRHRLLTTIEGGVVR